MNIKELAPINWGFFVYFREEGRFIYDYASNMITVS
ncbi:MAG: hypothetical protein FD183_906 [Chitinophagaceae bacterium]|nr:MAG: hypothetical protein FD183_906 [Chitinophagaceae bacterium]